MKRELMEILCCPVHKTDLRLKVIKEEAQEILEGALECPTCRFDYRIEEGIPRLLPPEMQRQEQDGASAR